MRTYFFIKLKSLKDIRTFPFSLYLYNTKEKFYNDYLAANTPMTEDSYQLLQYIEENKNGKIAIKMSQRMTYLATVGELVDVDPLEIAKAKKKTQVLSEYEKIVEADEAENKSAQPPLRMMMSKSIDRDDFLPIILRAQKEIILFPINLSHTVSLARHFASQHLHTDNLTNRIVALSYFFAKKVGIKEQQKLADLICAAFLCNIGLTQISPNIIHEDQNKISTDQIEQYYKHVKFSRMFIDQSKIDLSYECKKIIDHHHEKYDGSGMPSQVSQAGLTLESEILEFVTHTLEYSSGFITGEKNVLSSVIYMIDAQAGLPGLNINYSSKIRPYITQLLSL